VDPRDKKILIIGDLIIDKTIWVEVKKVSPEAPVPVAEILPYEGSQRSPGGAGFAAAFAEKDGIPSLFLTSCPVSTTSWLNKLGINAQAHETYDNVTKIRYIDIATNYHLIRVDTDQTIYPPNLRTFSGAIRFQDHVNSILESHDIACIMLLDYCKGLLTEETITQWLVETSKSNGIPIYTDSRSEDLTRFKDVNILKLNAKEYSFAFGALNASCALDVKSKLNVDTLIVTKGPEGAELYTCPPGGQWSESLYTPDLSKYSGSPDVTGCGDAFDVSFCYNWAILGKSLAESLKAAVDRASGFAYEPIGDRIIC
jgi:D-beta-D-heptose 7-phosphate kinase/D-beta-D-heptose 1-phosphate adenosyltransferase